jgi:hypothetical protein
MAFMERLRFSWDDVGTVIKLLESWSPEDCKREKDFENSLFAYLHAVLPSTQVTKQYGVGRTKADIVVNKSVAIEMKHNLDSTAEFQRLVGQLMDYEDWKGRIIVLLTGENDPELVKRVRAFLENQNNQIVIMDEAKFSLFIKPVRDAKAMA